jgi:hypothetical protein
LQKKGGLLLFRIVDKYIKEKKNPKHLGLTFGELWNLREGLDTGDCFTTFCELHNEVNTAGTIDHSIQITKTKLQKAVLLLIAQATDVVDLV